MSERFKEYANACDTAERVRRFQENEVVQCHISLKSKNGELLPDTLLLVGSVKLSKSGEKKIKGVFADEVDRIPFVPADIEYNVIYRRQDYFWTQEEKSWWVTEDKLCSANGAEAEKLHKKAETEQKLDRIFFVMFCIAVSAGFICFCGVFLKVCLKVFLTFGSIFDFMRR